jgi:hypothetical protein
MCFLHVFQRDFIVLYRIEKIYYEKRYRKVKVLL